SLGIELNYKLLSIRLGGNHYRYSCGMGIRIKNQFELDYSFTWDGAGMMHMASVQEKFGGRIKEEQRLKIMDEIINNRADGSYEDGMFEFNNKNYKTAGEAFKIALLWNPMFKKAEDMLEKTLEFIRTEEKTEEAETQEVKEETEIEIQKDCPSAAVLLNLYYDGIKFFMREEYLKALSVWNEILKCEPDNDKVKLNIKKTKLILKKKTGQEE
ncbi:MAG: hypothetical protein KAS39_02960, partial [Actinomycetia bacterium]|nr:hypothetical protein [Actinomycetes bacterium]